MFMLEDFACHMFCLLCKFGMSRPFRLPEKRNSKLPDAKLNVPLNRLLFSRFGNRGLENRLTLTHSDWSLSATERLMEDLIPIPFIILECRICQS